VVSIILVILLHHRGHGAKYYYSALSQEMTTIAGLLFVDDTDLLASGERPHEVILALQAAVNTWQQGLGITGGTLKWEKCLWSILTAYRFNRGEAYIHMPHSFHVEITIKLEDGSLLLIKQVPTSEGVLVVLRVVQTLNGKMLPQAEVLLEKAETWATNIRNRWLNWWLNWKLAWSCLNTMIWLLL
jgi:hypothetical protein